MDLRCSLIDSAQCFRWVETEKGFGAAFGDRAIWLRSDEDTIDPWMRHYLDLDRNYTDIALEYAHIPEAARAFQAFEGLHVLNQPPWEALIAFILSANNNVKRIRQLVHGICERLGEKREVDGCTLYGFPPPEIMAAADESVFRSLGCGYRAPYLVKTAQMVRDGFDLEALKQMDYTMALKELVRLSGVGEKVADCVLLFGCRHTEAFPVDVWVERMMRAWFAPDAKSKKQIKQTGRDLFGKEAGIVQQHLFHCVRVGIMELP